AAVNVNAASFTGAVISTTNSLTGFGTPSGTFVNAKAEDGFGKFNAGVDLFDGFTHSATEIQFSVTNTSGTWANVASVLTGNGDGNIAAAQIGACPVGCTGSSSFTATGFAAVPTPTVGAGLPSVVLACGGLLAFARRRRQKGARSTSNRRTSPCRPPCQHGLCFGQTTEYCDRALGKRIKLPVTATSNELHRQCADSEA